MNDNLKEQLKNWVERTTYVPRNVIPFVVKGFGPSVPDYEDLTKAVTAMIELNTVRIEGLYSGLRFGHDENFQLALVAQHADSAVQIGYADRLGHVYRELHRHWMGDLLLPIFQNKGIDENDPAFLDVCLDVVFFEPDPTYTCVVDAWHCKNFYPTATRSEGKRDVTVGNTRESLRVEYHSVVDQNEAVVKLAQEKLNGLNAWGLPESDREALAQRIAQDTLQGKSRE